MDHPSAQPSLVEIAVCAGAGHVHVFSATNSLGQPVHRFDSAEISLPQAKMFCMAMRRGICTKHAVEDDSFEIRPQIWADPNSGSGSFRSGWALLYRTSSHDLALVETFRRDAHAVGILLSSGPVTESVAPPEVEQPTASLITMDHLHGEPLLGARLATPLEVLVAEHRTLRIEGVLQRRPAGGFSTENHTIVSVRLTNAKLDGRVRHVSASGLEKATGQKFRAQRIIFGDRWRKQIAAAVEQPTARATMEIVRETVDAGLAKPRHEFKLVSLSVGDAAQD